MQNNKKKRRILIWILFVILHINVPFSKTEELKPENKNNEEENIFVFPSMQMEGIAAASSRDGKHVPVVEVVYRGQPPMENKKVTKTTTSSSDKTKTTRGKFSYFFLSNGNGILLPKLF